VGGDAALFMGDPRFCNFNYRDMTTGLRRCLSPQLWLSTAVLSLDLLKITLVIKSCYAAPTMTIGPVHEVFVITTRWAHPVE